MDSLVFCLLFLFLVNLIFCCGEMKNKFVFFMKLCDFVVIVVDLFERVWGLEFVLFVI